MSGVINLASLTCKFFVVECLGLECLAMGFDGMSRKFGVFAFSVKYKALGVVFVLEIPHLGKVGVGT